jgi:hypothetical protein
MSGEDQVHAVLDVSAMLSYARGHVHVGELLTEMCDEDKSVAVPIITLLDAATRLVGDTPGRTRLSVWATLPAVTVMSPTWQDAMDISTVVPFTSGDLARAHAVATAARFDVYYLTTEPHLVPAILDEELIVAIPEDDA